METGPRTGGHQTQVVGNFGEVDRTGFYRAGNRSILAMLEAAPTNKIMYASDAGGEPESLWHAALHFKDQLAKALEYYIAEDVIGYERAMQIAKNICRDNALRVYSRLQ